jgi:hypothetical protein
MGTCSLVGALKDGGELVQLPLKRLQFEQRYAGPLRLQGGWCSMLKEGE